MTLSITAYLESWSDELDARASRIRNLISDKHWLSDGIHKEFVLALFLKRYLPPSLSVSKGFIKLLDDSRENISCEVDILITDPERSPPLFAEGDFRVVTPESVVCSIEVKSKIETSTLKGALANVGSVKRLAPLAYSSIYFFDDTGLECQLSKWISKYCSDIPPAELPNSICCNNSFVAFLNGEGRKYSVFNAEKLCSALMLLDAYLSINPKSESDSFDEFLHNLSIDFVSIEL